jgi:hypothetical protein
MNRCHALGHLAVIVAGLAGAAVAFAAVPALASASPRPARLLSWADPPSRESTQALLRKHARTERS